MCIRDRAEAFRKVSQDEAAHAARIAELLGEKVFDNSRQALDMRINAEFLDGRSKAQLAHTAREAGADEVADAIGEMSRDESRHGELLRGLLKRLFSE